MTVEIDHLIKIEHGLTDTDSHVSTYVSEHDGKTIYCGSNFPISFLKERVTILTHNGKFHTDELVAICTLLSGPLIATNEVVIVRSRNSMYFDICDYVIDVGREYAPMYNRFDHHQPDFDVRYNDNTFYASAGLVFMSYGVQMLSNLLSIYTDKSILVYKELFDYVYEELHTFTKYVDNLDNGQKTANVSQKTVSCTNWISGLNPVRMFSSSLDAEYSNNFILALISLQNWMKNYIVKCAAMWLSITYLDALMKTPTVDNNPYLIIPYDLPWKELMWKRWNVLSKFNFIISKDKFTYTTSENWTIYNVPVSPEDYYTYKVTIPKELLGKHGAELEQLTGIPDLILCSGNGYFTYAKSKDAAIAFVEYVMQA